MRMTLSLAEYRKVRKRKKIKISSKNSDLITIYIAKIRQNIHCLLKTIKLSSDQINYNNYYQ